MSERCWIFGDEAGAIHKDRFFAVGIIGTTKPQELIEQLKEIRKRTDYFDEVSYKSSNEKRILCCIRWMDWFFSGQELAHFKILIKDSQEFDIKYYEKNSYNAGASQLAYCESYREVLGNFACYNSCEKGFIYSQIGLQNMQLQEYLMGKIPNLAKEFCMSKNSKEKKKDGSEYTGAAEILQLVDLLTSSTRGLCCSIYGENVSETWDKNTLRKNIHYHIPNIKEKLKNNLSVYHTHFEPYEKQIFVVYKWKGGSHAKAPLSVRK